MQSFDSDFNLRGTVDLPDFSGTRIMMMPVVIGDAGSLPESLHHYSECYNALCSMSDVQGEVGYLTIDERTVEPYKTHRRSGLHVDGIFAGKAGGWGGGGGAWGSRGMLTVSNPAGCRAWRGKIEGWPTDEGGCEHLTDNLSELECETLKPNHVYWLDGMCAHESMPMEKPTARQFVRLSMPSNAPWFEGYTENPKGVEPTGDILPRRQFMDQ